MEKRLLSNFLLYLYFSHTGCFFLLRLCATYKKIRNDITAVVLNCVPYLGSLYYVDLRVIKIFNSDKNIKDNFKDIIIHIYLYKCFFGIARSSIACWVPTDDSKADSSLMCKISVLLYFIKGNS